MNRLDSHIIENILLQSSPPDILSCAAVCHRFNQIVTESAAIQLVLHQYIYGSSDRHPSEGGASGPAREALSRLIRREKRFRDFTPRYSTLRLDHDQTIISAYGDAIVTRGYHRDSSVPDEKGLYLAYTLWTFKADKGEWDKRKIKVNFPPDLRGSLVDAGKDLMIVKKSHGGVAIFDYHIYHIPNGNEKGGEQLQAYPMDVLTIQSPCLYVLPGFHQGPTIFLGLNDTFQHKDGDSYSFYDYKNGFLSRVLQVPSRSLDSDCIFIGTHLLGRMFDGTVNSNQYLLVYNNIDLPSLEADNHTLPIFALRYPLEHSRLPIHIQNQVMRSENGQIALGYAGTIGSNESDGVVQIAFFAQKTRRNWENHEEGPDNDILVTRIPVMRILKMYDQIREGETNSIGTHSYDSELQALFPGTPIIEPENWMTNVFMSLESDFPDSSDESCVGTKVFAYKQPEKTEDVDWRNQPKQIQLIMYDFNQKAAKLQDRLGFTVGGLGQPTEARFDIPIDATEYMDPIDREKTKRTIITASKDSLGCVKHDITYTSCGDYIDSVHFDGNRLFVAHENSVVDILDFDD